MILASHGATTMTSDLVTDIKASQRAGFRAHEAWAAKLDDYLDGHSLAELKALFWDHGVAPTSINSIEFIGFRGAQFAKIRQRCRELCAIAEGIACPTLVVVPSPTPRAEADAVIDLFFPWEKVVDEYVGVLRDLSDIARPYGVRLAFEFLAFAWCSVRTPRGAYEIIEKVDRDNVGVNVDCCHFYGGGGAIAELDGLDPARVYTFHLNDMADVPKEAILDSLRLLPGQGVVPLDDICTHMKQIGYDGVCAIELFRAEYWERDPYEFHVVMREAATRVLSPYFTLE